MAERRNNWRCMICGVEFENYIDIIAHFKKFHHSHYLKRDGTDYIQFIGVD